MNPNRQTFIDHPGHFWVPLIAFVLSFLYPLFKWGLPWRLAFFIGIFGWVCELFVHRAFIGSY